MAHGLRCCAMPGHKTGFLSAICVVLSAAALLAASPGASHCPRRRRDDHAEDLFRQARPRRARRCLQPGRRRGPAGSKDPRGRAGGIAGAVSRPHPRRTRGGLPLVVFRQHACDSERRAHRRIAPPMSTSTTFASSFQAQRQAVAVRSSLPRWRRRSQQFPTVDRVILAIEGQPRLFYDWMDMECDETNDYCDARRF